MIEEATPHKQEGMFFKEFTEYQKEVSLKTGLENPETLSYRAWIENSLVEAKKELKISQIKNHSYSLSCKTASEQLEVMREWHKTHPDSHDIYCEKREGKACTCDLDDLLQKEGK